MSESRLRFGVVGLGRAGWDIHVSALRDRADVKVVAVADPVPERRKQAAEDLGAEAYDSLNALLKDDRIEVVVIATPSSAHAPDTLAALKAGKHVLVEKPMGVSLAEADSMIRAAEKADRKLFVHHQYRFNPEYTHLDDVVNSGKIGQLYHVRNYTSHFTRRNDWQTLSKYGGGLLNNHCSHMIDMILKLLGAPVKQVMADMRQIASAGDTEDHVKVFLRAANGRTADMEISMSQAVHPPLPKWILCGTTGTLTSDGQNSTLKWFDPKEAPELKVVDGPAEGRKYGNPEVLPWREETMPAKGTDVGTYYDNVVGVLRRGEPMRVTPQDVREVMRVLQLIRDAAKA